MYTTAGSDALKQYQQIGMRSAVEDASPHRLIQMMMEHALGRISYARGYMQRNEVAKKGESISTAISVINGLQASLNHNANKAMSENFDALYAYMMRRLLQANMDDDAAILDEVAGLMRELKDAWDAIADHPDVVSLKAPADT